MPLKGNQYKAVAKVVAASSRIERSDLIPAGELTIRWRIEAAAAFLASLIRHANAAAQDDEAAPDPRQVAESLVNLAVERAFEIHDQGHA